MKFKWLKGSLELLKTGASALIQSLWFFIVGVFKLPGDLLDKYLKGEFKK